MTTSSITRDRFDPKVVLKALENETLSPDETKRLLAEACHLAYRLMIVTRTHLTSLQDVCDAFAKGSGQYLDDRRS